MLTLGNLDNIPLTDLGNYTLQDIDTMTYPQLIAACIQHLNKFPIEQTSVTKSTESIPGQLLISIAGSLCATHIYEAFRDIVEFCGNQPEENWHLYIDIMRFILKALHYFM